jgi:hypothetical protein
MKTAEKPARIVAREPIVDRKQQLYGFFRIGEMGSYPARWRLEP